MADKRHSDLTPRRSTAPRSIEKLDPVVDYELDLAPLTKRALAAGLETFSLEATMRRLAGKNRAHRLQRGRYVITRVKEC